MEDAIRAASDALVELELATDRGYSTRNVSNQANALAHAALAVSTVYAKQKSGSLGV